MSGIKPYTSVVGWQSKSVECCVVSGPLSPDATERLAWCDWENISEYQNSLWGTMDAEVIPVSGNVFDMAYYVEMLAEKMRFLLNGSTHTIYKLYALHLLGLGVSGFVLLIASVCGGKYKIARLRFH